MPQRICVRGSINVDEFFEVDHIVRAGETISSTKYSRRPGGKGANASVAVAKAGVAVDFLGSINSQDTWLRDVLVSHHVGVSEQSLRSSVEPTGRAIIQIEASTGENSIVLLPGCNYNEYTLPGNLADTYSHLLVQNEIPLTQTCDALRIARKAGLVTIFNPSPVPPNTQLATIPWDCIDWLVLNADEARALAIALGSNAVNSLQGLTEILPSSTGIVMTKGADGVEAVVKSDAMSFEHFSQPAGRAQRPIINTTGAGDTFTGYLAAALVRREVQDESIRMDNILKEAATAATACCESEGAMEAIPTRAEVLARL